MAFQEIKFEFPDPDKSGDPLEVEGNPSETAMEEESFEDVEIIDDTPEPDRGKAPSEEPPAEVSEDELLSYSEKIRRRIQHLGKGYHDERRAKEEAIRQRDELENYARALTGKLKEMEQSSGKSREMLLSQAKHALNLEYEQAKKNYREAYESGDPDAVTEAQDKLTSAKIKMDKLANFKLPSVQDVKNDVKVAQNPAQPQQAPAPVKLDAKTEQWYKDNQWFGPNDEMTAFALGYHQKLLKQGVKSGSDDYFEKLDSRMRQIFPEEFDDGLEEEIKELDTKKVAKSASVVAPATRSLATKQFRLTKSQADIARRLGVSYSEYAKQVAELRKQNNG
jgi:AraC-like DNA-binding protein